MSYLDPANDDLDPGDFIRQSMRRTNTRALLSLDANPEEAQRAQQISEATGIPPAVVDGDLEHYDNQHRANLTLSLLQNNPELQAYVDSHPLAAKISNDDYGQLDAASSAMGPLARFGRPIASAATKAFGEGFQEGFGAFPIGGTAQSIAKEYNTGLLSTTAWYALTAPVELTLDTLSGIIKGGIDAAAKGSEQAYQSFGGSPQGAQSFSRAVGGIGEMVTQAPMHLVPEIAEATKLVEKVKPFIDAKKPVPTGLDPRIDQIKAEQAEVDVKDVMNAVKESAASATRERNPDMYASFARQHVGDQTIGIHADVIRELYGEKVPEADDGLLGFVPRLNEKLAIAEANGGYVEVPLADFLAKVEPDVAKTLEDFIRVRPEGVSKAEAKAMVEAYHGSPHDFEAFSMDKIGTGEGAQSYGHGLYFAENPRVAESYAVGRQTGGTFKAGGTGPFADVEMLDVAPPTKYRVRIHANKEDFLDWDSDPVDPKILNKLDPEFRTRLEDYLEEHDQPSLEDLKGEQVYRLLERFASEEPLPGDTGFGGNPKKEASQYLARLGVPGIKYLDQGSRGEWEVREDDRGGGKFGIENHAQGMDRVGFATEEEAVAEAKRLNEERTSNFVLFDDKLIEITHKNDQAVESLRRVAGTETQTKAMVEASGLRPPERGFRYTTADGSTIDVVPTEKMTAAERDLAAIAKQTVDRILGKDQVELHAADEIKFGGEQDVTGLHVTTEGLYPVIAYSIMDRGGRPLSDQVQRRIRHEAFHSLVHWGVLTPEELTTLKSAALAPNAEGKTWLDKHNVRERWKDIVEDQQAMVEEAIAEEYSKWGLEREKAGRMIEAYDKDIQGVFEKIHAFMEMLYARMQEFFGHPPEVTELFEKIESGEVAKRPRAEGEGEAKAQQGELPGITRMEDRQAFEAANAIGMTKDQYRRYMKLIEQRQREDLEASAKRALEAQKKTQTAEWKKNRAELRPEVVDQVKLRPDFIASDLIDKAKIDPKYLSEEQKALVPKEWLSKDGVNPDEIATAAGYQTGDSMITGTLALETQRRAAGMNKDSFFRRTVDAETDRQMEAKYGKLGDQILEDAKEQVLSETQLQLLHEDTLLAAEKAGAEFSITSAEVKRGAEALFREKEVRDVDSDRNLSDAGRAGRAAEDALLKNNPEEAFRQRQRQYLSALYAKAATEFEKVKAKFDARAKRFSAREVASTDQEYTDFIHDILTRVGLPVKRSIQDIQENIGRSGYKTLNDFVNAKEEALRDLHIPDWLLDPNFKKDLNDLTVKEFLQLNEALEAMAFNGREEKKVLRAGEKADLENVLRDMEAQLEDFDLKSYPIDKPRPISDKVKSLWWSGITLESMFNRLDRGKPGLFFNTITRVYNEAGIYKDRMIKDYQKRVAEVGKIPDIDKKVANDLWIDPISGQPFEMRRRNVLGILQNVGNDSNLKKLAGGYKLEPEQVMDWIVKNTTKEDWDRAQKIGDIFEELFEKANNMSHAISGVGIDRIPLSPIVTPFGTYKGWYNPIKYDPRRPGMSKELLGRGVEDEGYYKATTPQGYTEGRTGYIAPIELNLDIVPMRMKQMIHDITMRPAIIQLSKFFYNPKFERLITNKYGFHQAKEMVPFLRDIANVANFKSLAEQMGDSVVEGLRQNIIGVLIGLNPGTVMKHGTTALFNSMNEVGAMNWSREFMNIAKDLPAGRTDWKMAMEKSEELQRRMRNFTELVEGHGGNINLRGAKSTFGSFRDFAMSAGATPVSISDLLSAVPTWLAKYKDELAKGNNEGDAVALANRSVRLAHGSSNITNKPSIMRTGGPIKQTFTSLYGFFSHMLNKQYEMAWRAADAFSDAKEGNYAQAAGQLPRIANMFIAYIVLPAVIEEVVTPYTNSEKESWSMKAAKTLGLGASSSLIGVRDAVHALINARDPQAGLLSTWMKASTDLGRDLFSGKAMDPARAGRTINHATTAFGAMTGLTNAQEGRALEYLYRYHKGIERPKGPWDVAVGLRFGKTDHHSRSFEEWRKHTFGGH